MEMGFASASEAWRLPSRTWGEPDLEQQRLLYELLADAVHEVRRTREEITGLYLWNWSTDPDAGKQLDRSFTPQNRPALAGVERLFEEL